MDNGELIRSLRESGINEMTTDEDPTDVAVEVDGDVRRVTGVRFDDEINAVIIETARP